VAPEGSFPELVPVGGLASGETWQFKDGLDFYTYCSSREDDDHRIGFYVGSHANFHPSDGALKKPGRIAGQDITWFVTPSSEKAPRCSAETLTDYQHPGNFQPVQLHVWIVAPTERELEDTRTRLENLTFELRTKSAAN
jgi:hypothetical protein